MAPQTTEAVETLGDQLHETWYCPESKDCAMQARGPRVPTAPLACWTLSPRSPIPLLYVHRLAGPEPPSARHPEASPLGMAVEASAALLVYTSVLSFRDPFRTL